MTNLFKSHLKTRRTIGIVAMLTFITLFAIVSYASANKPAEINLAETHEATDREPANISPVHHADHHHCTHAGMHQDNAALEDVSDIVPYTECYQCLGTGKIACPVCSGSGYIETTCSECNGSGTNGRTYTCYTCDGTGVEGENLYGILPPICRSCNGRGYMYEDCEKCYGRGVQSELCDYGGFTSPGAHHFTCDKCGGLGIVYY